MKTIWAIESKIQGEYLPVEIEYTRDAARIQQRLYKARAKHLNHTPKTRIRRYEQDVFSRG